MSFMDVLALVGATWYCFLAAIAIGGWICVLTVYNNLPEEEEDKLKPEAYLSVSVLRPLHGLEPMLEECLESIFLSTAISPFEIILSVASPDDPSILVAKKVMSRYPGVQSQLIIGAVEAGVNPKINNLIKSFDNAKYPIIWILDSNSWVGPDTLKRSVAHFNDSRVNLVHHVPVAHALENGALGARLDDVYMGTMHAKMYAMINYCNIAPCVMGKSNLIRKAALAEEGLRSFAKYIAEDHLIATAVWTGRGSHVLGLDCVRQPLQEVSWNTFSGRRIRWVRVRKYMVTASTLVEPFTECFVNGLIGAWSLYHLNLSPLGPLTQFFVHVFFWIALDYFAWSHLQEQSSKNGHPFTSAITNIWEWLNLWLIREITALPLWCIAMISDKINWRGTQFVIARDMTARRVS